MILSRPPYLPDEEIREKAEEFRQKYLNPPDQVPVPIENVVEITLKIEPIPVALLKTTTDIDAFFTKDFKQIYIDEHIYSDPRMQKRLRFTYAHELGHLVLHKSLIDGIELESEKDWIDFRTGLSEDDLSRFEYQAYEFAGRLLVPKNKLIDELENHRGNIETFIENFKPYNNDELIKAVSRVISDVFIVSEDVIFRRINKENVWKDMGF